MTPQARGVGRAGDGHASGSVVRVHRDPTWWRAGPVLLAGSPLRRFRLTPAGERVAAVIEAAPTDAGAEVHPSYLLDRLLDAGAVHPLPAERATTTPPGFAPADVTIVTPRLGGVADDDGRITVDDGSCPPLDGAAVRLATNRGPAAARNTGRRLADTALIGFVDADVDLLDEIGGTGSWLDALLGHFDDPRVGLVAPRVRGEPGSPLDLGDTPARIRAGSRVSYVPAAAMVVRATAFDSVGGFDERMRHGEDVDLVWRLDEAGWRCRYEPRSVVWHEPRRTLRARLAQHATYGSSTAPLALRHPHALAPFRSSTATGAAWVLAAGGHPVAGLALATGELVRLLGRLPDVPRVGMARIALRHHGELARQLAGAVRRAWMPIVLVGAVRSRRARRVALVALLADPVSAPTDLAYCWGLWRGVLRHRAWRPLAPRRVVWRGGRDR